MSANVLIVGAGTTGLTLALSLLRNGLSVRIIEKQPKFQAGQRGAGYHSKPRTLEIHKFLGTLPDILKEAASVPTVTKHCMSPDDGQPPKLVPLMEHLENTPARPIHNAMALGQNFQERILRDHLLKEYDCAVELSTELCSFEQHPDHVVVHIVKTIDFQAVDETITVDWLVGADGARSTVRKQLGLSFVGETPPGASFIIGDIAVEGEAVKQDRGGWCIWGDSSHKISLSLRPALVPGKSIYAFIFRIPESDVPKVSSSPEEVIKALNDAIGRKDITLGGIEALGVWRPNMRMVDSFAKGRVFVAGDAAHIHSPTGAQGMNSGVQDSFNLGWKLALVQKGLSPASILDSYTEERVPVIASMLDKTTELFHKAFTAGKVDLTKGWYRGYELRMFGVNCRGSSLVLDEKYTDKEELADPYRSGEDGTVRGGDRAPDAPVLLPVGAATETETTTLFDVFKPTHFTALVFPGAAGEAAVTGALDTLHRYPKSVVQSVVLLYEPASNSSFPGANVTVVDTKGYAYTHYAIDQTQPVTVIIVRPDGYIGALVTSGEIGISSYFKRILL